MTMKDKRFMYVVLDNGYFFNAYKDKSTAASVAFAMSCVCTHEIEIVECLYPVVYDVYGNDYGRYRDELTALDVRQFCDGLYYMGTTHYPEKWA